ncbi:MAG TPA: glycosyltransferase family 2 protein [Candidatus Dormibacteraeota bacterium]|nr:glycosyltransferase family 2 protein [Candidatus Dormibacteraeota bacterium]
MDLSIIYVNWNSFAYLRESIASVYEHTHGISLEIVVVDNASPEGGVDALRERFPEITIIKSPDNIGFAGANNLGFRHSVGDYVLLFNPDTKLIAPSINIMLEHIKTLPDAGIIGCKLLNTDLSVQLSSIQKFPTILNQVVDAEYLRLRWPHSPFWGIAPLFSDDVKLLKVEVIPGACMLLRREVFAEVGMFSEDYFMYAEDIDLNYKLKRAGYTNYYVGETAIVHHGGRSSSQQRVSHWATIMKYRAMVRYFRKTRGRFYEGLYRIAIGFAAVGRLALLALMFPLGNVVWDKESLRFSSAKWKAVLKWALGPQELAIQNR